MSEKDQIEEQLTKLLGESCMEDLSFKPNDRERVLAKAVNYLNFQMGILISGEELSERKEYLKTLREKTFDILSENLEP